MKQFELVLNTFFLDLSTLSVSTLKSNSSGDIWNFSSHQAQNLFEIAIAQEPIYLIPHTLNFSLYSPWNRQACNFEYEGRLTKYFASLYFEECLNQAFILIP